MEVSFIGIQKMLDDGEISAEQFTSILIDSFGEETVKNLMKETIKEIYASEILTKELPDSVKNI